MTKAEGHGPAVVAALILSLVIFISLLIFTIYLLLRGNYRVLKYQLAANILFGHLLPAVLLFPADIHMQVLNLAGHPYYCILYEHIRVVYLLLTPYTLLMLSVERLMYIRNPIGHEEKINRAGTIAFLAAPWVLTVVFAAASVHPNTQLYHWRYWDIERNTTTYECFRSRVFDAFDVDVQLLLCEVAPALASLIIALTAAGFWCYYKRKMPIGTSYAMMGEGVEEDVRSMVILVVVINVLFIPFVLSNQFFSYAYFSAYYPLISRGVFGTIEAVLLIVLLPEIRRNCASSFLRICCCRKAEEPPPMSYKECEKEINVMESQ